MKNRFVLLLFILFAFLSYGQREVRDALPLPFHEIDMMVVDEQFSDDLSASAPTEVYIARRNVGEIIPEESLNNEEPIEGRKAGLKKGYRAIVEVGYEFDSGESFVYSDRVKVNFINGYQLSPFLSIGVGTGLRYYVEYPEMYMVPLFADVRANLAGEYSAYVALGVGNIYDPTDRFRKARLLISPSFGLSFMVSEHSSMNVGVGYEIQRWDVLRHIPDRSSFASSGHISLNVGFSF